ncbi:MAG: HNH endonuclease [Chryseobacterium sp.]
MISFIKNLFGLRSGIKNLFELRSGKWNGRRKKWLIENDSCIACGKKSSLQVHHKIPVHIDESKELIEDNFCTLCATCHFVFGHSHNWSLYNPFVIEDCENHLKRVKENQKINQSLQKKQY